MRGTELNGATDIAQCAGDDEHLALKGHERTLDPLRSL